MVTSQDTLEEIKVGVYVCECGINISSIVDVESVSEFAKELPNVVVSRNYKYMCSEPGQNLIKEDIKNLGINRVVVASCSPRMHEPTFRNVLEDAGENPYCFEMTNIREQCSWVHTDKERATIKAKQLVKMAIAKASLLEPLEKTEKEVLPKALVIGGGIAGIQASLEIANNGFKTYLVEKSPSIGGRMAQLDKTFPTLDCSACILTPKMVDVARNPNIELITYADVKKVEGSIGNFKVTVVKKPRYIDMEKCVGCGACAEECRLHGKISNEFNEGLGKRAAAYIPFPQAIPLKYVIDDTKCLFLTRGKCGKSPKCADACQADAVDFTQKAEEIELDVGTIIVATGYDLFDPNNIEEYHYEENENIITGIEFERMVSSSGPSGGKILVDGKEPENVAFIQCVGSRDKEHNEYCSRVCCMYTAKQAHLVREKLPNAKITIFYTDVRAFGKGFEEFYNRVKGENIDYKRRELGDPIEIIKNEDKLFVKTDKGETRADLVVLATAIQSKRDIKELSQILKVSQSADGFLLEAHPKLRPVDTNTGGIFLAGCCQSPKDIPDTVAQACGAAAKALIPLSKGKVDIEPLISFVVDEFCDGCAFCIDPCPYQALTLLEYNYKGAIKKTVEANDALCKGCGVCQATCPKGGIVVKGFKLEQLSAMVEAAMGAC